MMDFTETSRGRRTIFAGMAACVLLCSALLVGCGQRTSPTNQSATRAVRVVWSFEQPERGSIISTPCVSADRVYVGTIQDVGLTTYGTVCCLDRGTGKLVWKFDDDGEMKHMYSSPCLADGRLYIGEGMHANHVCKLYCLDAQTGRKLWQHETAGHIESSPCVVEGRVYFGSGDDGIWCLDAATGKPVWHFKESLHIDSNPAVVGGRVYVGSGLSRRYRATEVLCLDAQSGQVVWRVPTELPAWGSPTVSGEYVFFGLGNGRLMKSVDPPEKPAGAVLCAEAATGRRLWQYDVADGVLMQPIADERNVYFAARDGQCYAVDRQQGRFRWKTDMGSPVVTRLALVDGRLYVVPTLGLVRCLTAETGATIWTFDLAKHTQTKPQMFSAPVVLREPGDAADGRRIYFGAELRGPLNNAAVLYCLGD